ncbi:MAG TPA: transglutaminase-like domain-containing protein [Burkholderiales bacterium]|nr:transglutaminase-like domain-containing protein [Burkholderiales bacterium]
MKARTAASALVSALLIFLSGCAGQYFRDAGAPPQPPRYSLANLPQPEYWTGIVFNGAKIGFSHTRVTPAGGGTYELQGEAVLRFRLLGYEKRVQVHSIDTVDENARLVRFSYRYLLDGTEQEVSGEVREERLRYRVATAGRPPEQKEETLSGPLYPSGALGLLPVLEGLRVGREFQWLVFNGETRGIDPATQRIVAYEASDLFSGNAFKVQTDMLGLHSTTWIDERGLPVLELGLNGIIVSALEDERTAKSYLTSAALNKDEVLVSWSLVKSPLSLPDPRRAKYLKFTLLAPSPARVPLSDSRQRCAGSAGDLVCEIDAARAAAEDGTSATALLPSSTVQSRDPMIRKLAQSIAGQRASAADKVEAVLAWLDRNIAKEAVDTFSALDVLDAKRGECQGHAYLYAALMRALEVPTRVVNGLVYSPENQGFLYHTWAESLVDSGWRAVDPTFNQNPADATHIALVRGETLTDLTPLVDWVGNTRIRVLDAR